MIKNTLPDKLGNPKSLEKEPQQSESFSTNVGGDLLREFHRLYFIYKFVVQMISEKPLCSKGISSNLRDIFT